MSPLEIGLFWRWLIAVRVGRARSLDLRPHLGRALREDEAGDEGEHGLQAGDLVLAVEAGAEVGLVARACSHLDAPVVALFVRVRPCSDDMTLFTGLM